MKAQATNSAQNLFGSRERFRTGLIFGGIVVAIIVSIFLVQDAGAQPSITNLLPRGSVSSHLAQPTTTVGVELISNMVTAWF